MLSQLWRLNLKSWSRRKKLFKLTVLKWYANFWLTYCFYKLFTNQINEVKPTSHSLTLDVSKSAPHFYLPPLSICTWNWPKHQAKWSVFRLEGLARVRLLRPRAYDFCSPPTRRCPLHGCHHSTLGSPGRAGAGGGSKFSSGKPHMSTNASCDRWATLCECVCACVCEFVAVCAQLRPPPSSRTPKRSTRPLWLATIYSAAGNIRCYLTHSHPASVCINGFAVKT